MNIKQIQDQLDTPRQSRGALISGSIPPSSQVEIDEALQALQDKKDTWVALGIQQRIDILDEIAKDMQTVADRWAGAGIEAQDLQTNSAGIGEKYLLVSLVHRLVRLTRQSLLDIQQFGRSRIPGPVNQRPNGQITAQVFPQSWYDRLSMMGITGEVWMMSGTPVVDGRPPQASIYHGQEREGKVALVLGVGNVAAVVVADFMHKLFVEGQVVVLKPSPVNEYMGPLIEEGFQALIRRDYMRVVYGGPAEGATLTQHPAVDEIHMTGSARTFENIVFGAGEEGTRRKAARNPRITKPITAELGNISPVIIVPGPWSADDIRAQAGKIGSWLSTNAGYGCLTPRMIINWRQWDQRRQLNEAIVDFLGQVPTRTAYYPGTAAIHEKFVAAHPEAQQIGNPPNNHLPWTYIAGVDSENKDDICFTTEAFCGLCAETALEADRVESYIAQAVDFANENLWGNLVATIIVHPQSMKDPVIAAAVERTIERLQYGTVVINQWGVVAYLLATTSWGPYPGQDIYDIQSGIGSGNNVLMFDSPQKAVVRCPFKQSPDPFLATSRNAPDFGRKLADFQRKPSVVSLGRLFLAALKS